MTATSIAQVPATYAPVPARFLTPAALDRVYAAWASASDDDRTEDPRCSFCNTELAEDGDCDRCQRMWDRGVTL